MTLPFCIKRLAGYSEGQKNAVIARSESDVAISKRLLRYARNDSSYVYLFMSFTIVPEESSVHPWCLFSSFLSCFAARFSFRVFVASFFVDFLVIRPLLIFSSLCWMSYC